MTGHDVYSYGVVSLSTLYRIRGAFPGPEGYAEIDDVQHMTGGDSFRAGIVYGFLKGWSVDRMINFAAALAALTCTRFPGALNAPTYDEVSDFMGAAKA